MKKSKFMIFEFIAYVIILCGIVFVGIKTFFPNEYDQTISKKLYVVLTDSMTPTIKPLSAIIVDRSVTDYSVGDIITFEIDFNNDGSKDLVTHRLDEIKEDGILTRSDQGDVVDRWLVDEANIVGKVVLVIPHVGAFILGVQKVAIPILLLSMLLIIVLLIQTLYRWKKI